MTALFSLKSTAKKIVPSTVYRPILAWWRQSHRPHWGSLRRLTPLSRAFGLDRGLPICWYYIQNFLSLYAQDIRGHVLEIGDDSYTRKFGGERVTKSDVLHVTEGNPKATIVANLTCADQIPSDSFDCIIFTQTLQHIYDVRATIQTIHRILRPGGVLLATFPGISQISRYDMDRWGDYWRFTTACAHKLFGEFWPPQYIMIESFGNVLVAISYLQGLASGDLRADELEFRDPDYQVLITARAVKPLGGKGVLQ